MEKNYGSFILLPYYIMQRLRLKNRDKFEQVWKESGGILFASMIVNSTVCRQKTMKELTNASLK